MSMKDNVDYIKEELSAQESLLQNSIKAERFWKKYKKAIIAAGVVAVLGFIVNSSLNYMAEQKKIESNTALNILLENPNDEQALKTLESSNKKLHSIALYMQNRSNETQVEFLKELASYSKALEEKNPQAIGMVSQNQNFINKDFALLNKAILEASDGKYKDAKDTLKLIPTTSSAANLVSLLNHYLLTK